MNIRPRLFLFTLGLPLLATVMAWASITKVDGNLREEIHKQYPTVSAERLAGVTVASIAEKGGFGPAAELPGIYAHLRQARLVAIATGALGLLLIGGIAYAGYVTRSRRDLLLRLFRPGIFVTLGAVGLLTVAQALAAAYSLYYFESIFIERVHYILIIGVSIGGVLALVAVVRAIFSLAHSSEFQALGHHVHPKEQPRLWSVVNAICAELKAEPPDNIVLGLEPTFYVTESDVISSSGRVQGRTLFLSLALSRLLSLAELRAIIGHEMAHFIGEDTIFSQRFFPVYRGTLVALHNLSRNSVHGSVAIAQLPAITFLGFFFDSFVTSEKNLSRLRETEADAVGARVGGKTNLATALVKVHAYADGWRAIVENVRYNHESLREETNFSRPFHQLAAALTSDELKKSGEKEISHPTDSHPTLTQRLQSLEADLTSLLPTTSVPPFEESAAALVVGLEDMEVHQSGEMRKRLRGS